MLARDGFRGRRGGFGRPEETVKKPVDSETARKEAIAAAAELARKAGMNTNEIAKIMDQAGATEHEIAVVIDAIKKGIEKGVDQVTATTATSTTPKSGGDIPAPTTTVAVAVEPALAKAKSTSPWMLALGAFVAWKILK